MEVPAESGGSNITQYLVDVDTVSTFSSTSLVTLTVEANEVRSRCRHAAVHHTACHVGIRCAWFSPNMKPPSTMAWTCRCEQNEAALRVLSYTDEFLSQVCHAHHCGGGGHILHVLPVDLAIHQMGESSRTCSLDSIAPHACNESSIKC